MGHFIAASELGLVPPLNTSIEKCLDLQRYSFLSFLPWVEFSPLFCAR